MNARVELCLHNFVSNLFWFPVDTKVSDVCGRMMEYSGSLLQLEHFVDHRFSIFELNIPPAPYFIVNGGTYFRFYSFTSRQLKVEFDINFKAHKTGCKLFPDPINFKITKLPKSLIFSTAITMLKSKKRSESFKLNFILFPFQVRFNIINTCHNKTR